MCASPEAVRIIKHETMGRTDEDEVRIRGESERHVPPIRPSVRLCPPLCLPVSSDALLLGTSFFSDRQDHRSCIHLNQDLKRRTQAHPCLLFLLVISCLPSVTHRKLVPASLQSSLVCRLFCVQTGKRMSRSFESAGKEQRLPLDIQRSSDDWFALLISLLDVAKKAPHVITVS